MRVASCTVRPGDLQCSVGVVVLVVVLVGAVVMVVKVEMMVVVVMMLVVHCVVWIYSVSALHCGR